MSDAGLEALRARLRERGVAATVERVEAVTLLRVADPAALADAALRRELATLAREQGAAPLALELA